MENVKALFKRRRFWTAIGGVGVVAAQEALGLDPETTNRIVALAVAWILGDSLRVTDSSSNSE